jgi:peptidoglycan/xylan/chitin deacetylase (PgdA/CDA1 family)
MQLLTPDHVRVEPRTLDAKVALLSLDAETDFGTGRTEALSGIDRLADLLAELGVPWTAFVEGRFYEERQDVCRLLRDRGADLQVHCYDHGEPGDTAAALARSAAAYADFCGRRPAGYRAHTYRLTPPLYDALVAEGFGWDSSLLRAWGQGGNRHPGFRAGDYLVLDDRLVEFPIGTWRGLPVPINHTHVLLAKTPGERLLRMLGGPSRLVAYNFHMTDLVRCRSLSVAKRPRTVKLLYRYLWSTHGGDTFAVVRRMVGYLKRKGYTFLATDDLYRRVTRART